ncbi:hypothetical protein [Belnapia moabensis]|uniref:hypothetical protein n=1 Tax=Belnapia moabensis TaxID=365533 RepID=UPI000A06F048
MSARSQWSRSRFPQMAPSTCQQSSTSAAPFRIGGEMLVRRALHAAGLRYVLYDKRLPGRPNIVLPSRGCIVEVRGCFWHRHLAPRCPPTRMPKSRLEF